MWEMMTNVLVTVLALVPAERRARSDAHEKMRIAVMKAFHKTETYYQTRFGGHGNIRDQELAIAQAWSEAAILVEKFDQGLAERLGKKSQFWCDEVAWSDEEIRSAGIGLDRVRREAMILKK
jgi:hypothetical protein